MAKVKKENVCLTISLFYKMKTTCMHEQFLPEGTPANVMLT